MKRVLFICAAAVVLALGGWLLVNSILAPTGPESPAVDAEPRPDDPFYWANAPLRADGTRDFLALLNRELGKDVPLEENAFVAFVETADPHEWGAEHLAAVRLALGLPQEQSAGPVFESPDVYTDKGLAEQFERALDGPWSPDDAPLVAASLDQNAAALQVIEAGLARPRYYAPLVPARADAAMIETLIPQLGMQRSVARSLAARANLRLKQGDIDGAWSDTILILRVAAHSSNEPFILGQLVAISVQLVGSDQVRILASHNELTTAQARQIAAEWAARPRRKPVAWGVDVGERLSLIDAMLLIARGRDSELAPIPELGELLAAEGYDETYAIEYLNQAIDERVALLAYGSISELLRAANAIEEREIDQAPDTALLLANPKQLEDRIRGGGPDASRQVTEAITDAYLSLLLPSLDSLAGTFARHRGRDAQVPVILALGAYRTEHGDYPDALGLLVPAYLDQLPADPLAKDGATFRYRRTDKGVMLYSVGTNQTDDGGREKDDEGKMDDLVTRLE